jgi:hypothetical protein
LSTPGDFENTLFRITVYENRSARWTIQHARPLNESEREDFEAFAAEFNTQETETFQAFRSRTRSLLSFARNTTGRTMTARSFDRRAYVNELGQPRGVVELSFVWTGFARSNETTVRVGDIFEGGMYIAQGQRLEFRPGPELEFRDVQPSPDSMANSDAISGSESVTWTGERQFADQRPAVVLGAENASTPDGVAATGGGDSGGGASPSDALPIAMGGLVVVLAVLGGLAWYRVRGPDGEGAATTEPVAASTAGRSRDGASGGAAAVGEAELLSDEDRVLRLLEENGGRMKQVDIVDRTEWSKSKVSMLLSEMEEADQISKLRLGRENVISVAGEEPDAAGSPFEEIE